MRPSRRFTFGAAVGLLFFCGTPCSAQQGSLQVSAAVQGTTGAPERVAGQPAIDPDFGVSWLQPGSRFGVFQIELRGARRGDSLHTGRMYGAVRDLKYRNAVWTIEAGDAHFSPGLGEYRLANLFTPVVTFNGAALSGRSAHSSLVLLAGKTTAWRNIFGNDPQALGQSLGVVRLTHQPTGRLEVSSRASRVRTSSLHEFSYAVDAGDQVGGGARFGLTPTVQLVADASVVSYRRTGLTTRQRDGSYLAGANWLHSRGWLQVNMSRFSPGDFPALNNPLQDREGLFAAGDYDLWSKMRLSAGWESFRSNLRPDDSLASSRPTPQSSGTRSFAGVRVQVTSRSALALRGERGARESRPMGAGFYSESDTGSWAAEWQAALGKTNAYVRYSERNNVEHLNFFGSSDQRDTSAQIFANLSQHAQVFATALVTRTAMVDGGGSTYWQVGGGTQIRLPRRDLWLRGEGASAHNVDAVNRTFVPRESVGVGLNGQLSREMSIAFNVNLDRAVFPAMNGSPWVSRSTVRLTRTLATGSVYLANGTILSGSAGGRGTGTISGAVFVDWNANGVVDAGENALEGIALQLGSGHSTTGRDGQFSFLNVPIGLREVALDTGALPIDFDPPAVPQIQVELSRGDTRRVAFGLIPLGSIEGRVIRDANKNGSADQGEEAVDGAVLILDGGARSEVTRKGRYRFDAVRSGAHTVKLLVDSLPEGSQIAGEAEVAALLTREALAGDVSFLVSIDKRPEIRRVFPPRPGLTASSARPSPAPTAATRATGQPARKVAEARTSSAPVSRDAVGLEPQGAFAIQIAALSDPLRAKDVAGELMAAGMPAYLVIPPAADPDAPYKVRVGPYTTRAAAEKTAAVLGQRRREKVWVMREMSLEGTKGTEFTTKERR
jgi:cell division septation protein DedD